MCRLIRIAGDAPLFSHHPIDFLFSTLADAPHERPRRSRSSIFQGGAGRVVRSPTFFIGIATRSQAGRSRRQDTLGDSPPSYQVTLDVSHPGLLDHAKRLLRRHLPRWVTRCARLRTRRSHRREHGRRRGRYEYPPCPSDLSLIPRVSWPAACDAT
jgi:hypothetical protein